MKIGYIYIGEITKRPIALDWLECMKKLMWLFSPYMWNNINNWRYVYNYKTMFCIIFLKKCRTPHPSIRYRRDAILNKFVIIVPCMYSSRHVCTLQDHTPAEYNSVGISFPYFAWYSMNVYVCNVVNIVLMPWAWVHHEFYTLLLSTLWL